ncbi:MAG TPA: hypothetical protein V6C57_04715 [Coleofasciculaceae cyanobacterium]
MVTLATRLSLPDFRWLRKTIALLNSHRYRYFQLSQVQIMF